MANKDLADAFFHKYRGLIVRLSPFKLKVDKETIKTVGIIEALLNRAYDVHSGANAFGRYGVTAGHNVESYIGTATEYLEELERGNFPLKGLFAEPGMNVCDHAFVIKDDVIHCFYNRGYIGYEWDTRFIDTFGHIVSTDMVNWKVLPPAFSLDGSKYEDYQIWSPGIVKKDDTYYMYYTSVNKNAAESISLATSKDLINWKHYEKNPVVLPGKWGDWNFDRWSDCRDSFVLLDGDTAYMYYFARFKNQTPVIAISKSYDMFDWQDCGTVEMNNCDTALESPTVIKYGEFYFMLFTHCGLGTCYAVSNNPINNWEYKGVLFSKRREALCDANVPSCPEIVNFKDKWYISCCERLPRNEQYLEIYELTIDNDTLVVGKQVEIQEI